MKPYPLSSLNHLTVPVATALTSCLITNKQGKAADRAPVLVLGYLRSIRRAARKGATHPQRRLQYRRALFANTERGQAQRLAYYEARKAQRASPYLLHAREGPFASRPDAWSTLDCTVWRSAQAPVRSRLVSTCAAVVVWRNRDTLPLALVVASAEAY
jgi:hypothetical protein